MFLNEYGGASCGNLNLSAAQLLVREDDMTQPKSDRISMPVDQELISEVITFRELFFDWIRTEGSRSLFRQYGLASRRNYSVVLPNAYNALAAF